MVEKSPSPSIVLSAFSNYESFQEHQDLEQELLESNKEQIESEMECLSQILTNQEYKELEPKLLFLNSKEAELSQISKVIKLSLMPTSSRKFILFDIPKDIKIELRCLPVLEMYVVIPTFYPSSGSPLVFLETPFYKPFNEVLMQKLAEKWQPDIPVVYDYTDFITNDLVNTFFEESQSSSFPLSKEGHVEIKYNSSTDFQKDFDLAQQAQRRIFNNEEHVCDICMKHLLGNKFFFLSGCEHFFCYECIQQQVILKINSCQVSQIACPEASCKKNMNDLDIHAVGLGREMLDKYEQFSLSNAIAQMDDLGWCPLAGCASLATIERESNSGKCQHCDFMFCLDCRERYHPYKRCSITRLDIHNLISEAEKESLEKKNKVAEALLTDLFLKVCAKYCPNQKCGIKIQKIKSGCTKMQCPKCFQNFCWVCLQNAKGMKHFKERPDCNVEEGNLQPEELTIDMIQKHLTAGEEYINLKHCVKCPKCSSINEKKTRSNLLSCVKCCETFCYICNKSIGGAEHFKGKSYCHLESDPYSDF